MKPVILFKRKFTCDYAQIADSFSRGNGSYPDSQEATGNSSYSYTLDIVSLIREMNGDNTGCRNLGFLREHQYIAKNKV